MIDIDHYFWYILETKKWNPLVAIKWYMRTSPKYQKLSIKKKNKLKKGIFVFHSVFFMLLLAVLTNYHKFFFWVLIGVLIHMTVDWLDLFLKREPFYCKLFPCYTIIRNKNKKELIEL